MLGGRVRQTEMKTDRDRDRARQRDYKLICAMLCIWRSENKDHLPLL